MSVTGLDNVVGRLKLEFDVAKNEKTEAAITEMLIVGGSNASALTPVDRGNLISSQGRKTYQGVNGWAGTVFYGARYAGWVHKMSGKLKGKPRANFGFTSNRSNAGPQKPKAFGAGSGNGTYWSPDAEPDFLTKGMEEMAKDNSAAILRKHYQV